MNGRETFSSGRRTTNVVQSFARSCMKWTIDQGTALVNSLVNLVNMGGWKVDNGQFKGGYQHELKRLMKEKLVRLRNKSFPYYDELDYVYGKDRVTGGGAENPADVVEDITLNEQEHQAQHVESPFLGIKMLSKRKITL
ncbi:hypothetical protein Sjap_025882 [Stephania japonica]|uniref:Retrotransposon protein n=1 Tax=Stephania japonica TaxID=461633 RepID=A0AAP0HID4_9MAGN